MALVVLNPHSDGVVVSDKELHEIIAALDLYTVKLEDLLKTVILAYAMVARDPAKAEAFRPIVKWIQDNYIDLRGLLPPDLKRLYLHEIAFRAQ